jgi:hypothetical protein
VKQNSFTDAHSSTRIRHKLKARSLRGRRRRRRRERERGGGRPKRLVWTEPAWRAGKGNGRERKGAVFPRPSAETKQPFYIRIQCRSSSIRILRGRSIVICSIVQNMSSHLIHTNTSMCKCHVHWHLVVY